MAKGSICEFNVLGRVNAGQRRQPLIHPIADEATRPLYQNCTCGQWNADKRKANLTFMSAAGVNSRHTRLPTRLALALAASLVVVGPAAAQTHSMPGQPLLVSELRVSTPIEWNAPGPQFSRPDPMAAEAPAAPEWSATPDSLAASVSYSSTPFLQEIRVPLGSLLKGRVHILGFNDTIPMANSLWGLYGPRSESNLNPAGGMVPGLAEPANDTAFGWALTLSSKGPCDPGMASKLLHRAGRFAERKAR
jgi:hypothetical protein